MSSQVIIHEGYLFKTPPLDRFFVNWKKRWFVLSRHSNYHDLAYYTDSTKKEKKTSINIRQIQKINPVHSSKTKDNAFSIEMEDGKKFVLKSPDKEGKAVWVAKLLECTKEGTAYHVTVPNQPAAQYAQCIVKLNSPLRVNVISSLEGNSVMSIPFNQIRRFGCQVVLASDIVWFETCSCGEEMEEFKFFVVALGIEKAYQIVQEYKRSMELGLREHMVMEESDETQYRYSYIVKSHYGHSDYPIETRERILQSSIMSLSTSTNGALSLSDLNKFARSRPSLPAIQAPVPGGGGGVRKLSDATLLNPISHRSPSPSPSPTSPNNSRLTLDQLQKSPRSSRSGSRSGFQSSESSGTAEFDSGVNFDEVDPSRFSAPAHNSASTRPPPPKPLERLGKSFDESPPSSRKNGGKVTLQNFKSNSVSSKQTQKISLSDLQAKRELYASQNQQKHRRKTDSADSLLTPGSDLSALGGEGQRGRGSHTTNLSPYDHLSPSRVSRNPYDHLAERVQGVSLQSAAVAGGGGSHGNGRRHNNAYADF